MSCFCKDSDTISTHKESPLRREEMHPCPWCGLGIVIVKRNCGIIRCGVYKSKKGKKYRQMPKHGSIEKIRKIMDTASNVIGCGQPVRITKSGKLIKGNWDD